MNRETLEYKRLTKRDLDKRIVRVAAELFATERAKKDVSEAWAPVPIDTADFVRRMRPYMVYN